LRKGAQSVGQKTKSEESPKPVIDDWYEDWKSLGRGLIWSYEQDILRCAYCKKDLLVYSDNASINRHAFYDDSGDEVHYSLFLPVAIRSAKTKSGRVCLCKNEECQTIWSMSVGLE